MSSHNNYNTHRSPPSSPTSQAAWRSRSPPLSPLPSLSTTLPGLTAFDRAVHVFNISNTTSQGINDASVSSTGSSDRVIFSSEEQLLVSIRTVFFFCVGVCLVYGGGVRGSFSLCCSWWETRKGGNEEINALKEGASTHPVCPLAVAKRGTRAIDRYRTIFFHFVLPCERKKLLYKDESSPFILFSLSDPIAIIKNEIFPPLFCSE